MVTDLAEERLGALLETRCYGKHLIIKDVTESTNDDARRLAKEDSPRGTVIVANTQTKGRGARGRVWSSPPGEDLYFSVVEYVALPSPAISSLALAVGLGVANALDAFVGKSERALVKWPNDVLLAKKKCAGILVETQSLDASRTAVIIGIGLNVNRESWDMPLDFPATSLRNIAGQNFDRAHVFCKLLNEVESAVSAHLDYGAIKTITQLENRLAFVGSNVSCNDVAGTFMGLDHDGFAQIKTGNDIVRVLSGPMRPLS